MGPPKLTREEKVGRFFLRVVRNRDDQCWEWLGKTDKDGYGIFGGGSQLEEETRIHRISFLIHYGAIPAGIYVLHTCDNPPCSNPRHLFLGTAADNLRDCISKGRQVIAVGSGQGGAKLHETVISEIRKRWRNRLSDSRRHNHPDSQTAIARDYGVDQAQISRIVNGSAWIHV